MDHPGSRVSDDEAEGVILGLRDRRGLLRMRDGLVEAPLLGQGESQPHARENRRKAGELKGFPAEVSLELRDVARESIRRLGIVTEGMVDLP